MMPERMTYLRLGHVTFTGWRAYAMAFAVFGGPTFAFGWLCGIIAARLTGLP